MRKPFGYRLKALIFGPRTYAKYMITIVCTLATWRRTDLNRNEMNFQHYGRNIAEQNVAGEKLFSRSRCHGLHIVCTP